MHPVLFRIGTFEVHTYGFLGAVAFLIGCAISLVRCRRLGVPYERTADVIFWTGVIALLGARLVYLAQTPVALEHWTDLFGFRDGGLVFYGAFLTGIPAGSLLMWRLKLPFYATWDAFATAFPLSHAITRVGCFAAGCCYGAPTDGPLGVTYPDTGIAPPGVALHPVQLYEAAWLLVVAAVVNLFYARRRFDGQVMMLYLMLYALGRSALEVLRGDAERGWFLPSVLGEVLTFSQGTSLLVALVALVVFYAGARRRSPKARPTT